MVRHSVHCLNDMQRIFVLLLLLSGVSIGTTRAIAQDLDSSVASHGTLIVAIPTQEGLVICADRRVHTKTGDRDDVLKIRQLDSRSIYAASGLLYVTTDQELFNLNKSIEGHLPFGLASYGIETPLLREREPSNLF